MIRMMILACATVWLVGSRASYSEIPENASLHRLATWLIGTYSSEEQAKVDTDYFDIRLHMVRVWKERSDGYWLYVEQALASKRERPYRQRVYHLTQPTDSTFESVVFTLPDPLRFAGAWKSLEPLAELTTDSLVKREGCSIVLKQIDAELFAGSTVGIGCPSELRGAAYATSEVRLWNDKMISWDRGYDKDGKQVWGATTGGYFFRKIKD